MIKSKIKRLHRVTTGKKPILGGVCAGIADYVEVDPTLIRLLWVLMTVFSAGFGIFAYLVMWIIMPRK